MSRRRTKSTKDASDSSARSLAILAALLFALIWRVWQLFPERAQSAVVVLLVAAIAATALLGLWRSRDDLHGLGLSPAAWRFGWRPLLLASGFGLVALGALGFAFGQFSLAAARLEWVLRYATGLFAQQLLLQCVFNHQLERIARGRSLERPERWAAARATLLFSALHAPNPVLMVGTALAGWAWTRHFHRYHNLLALLWSHATLGVAAMIALGPGPMLDLRVGPSALSRLATFFS